MKKPFFQIDGVDYASWIISTGYGTESNDIDAPDSGRTLDGGMVRGKVTSKKKFEIEFRPTPDVILSPLFDLLDAVENVTVFTNMLVGQRDTYITMYNSSRTAVIDGFNSDWAITWSDIKFNLIEV